MSSSPRNRVKSAPYRFPEQTASQYHAHCSASPKERVKSAGASPSPMKTNYDQLQKNSEVVQDEIWKSTCWKERGREVKWEQTWGFLKNYDAKGNIKEPKQYADHERSLYSTSVPNTCNGHYGQRVRSTNSVHIQRLERTPHKLRKNEEILYCE